MALFSFFAKPKHTVAFVDAEVGVTDGRVRDIGALMEDGASLHTPSIARIASFVQQARYLCGHNIVHHDIPHLFGKEPLPWLLIDTLYLSPLLFPRRPYHHLVKDYKLQTDEPNNPLDDCRKTRDLLADEAEAYGRLPKEMQQILGQLLAGQPEFEGFFRYVDFHPGGEGVAALTARHFEGRLCAHADIGEIAAAQPVELAYALALISTDEAGSITPPWVLHTYPAVQTLTRRLRHTPCAEGCPYCRRMFDPVEQLQRHFGYDQFRTFGGEPMQERAVRAAMAGESLLAIFPTGGGKSLTFQLPALVAGESVRGLTVVISPLQSLMMDQVESLERRGITTAATLNGMQDPLSRAEAARRVAEGTATLLYIAPEMLRSKTIEKLLGGRHVVRVVVDEAHCFSAWGQDFRVEYLYIGTFIRRLREQKQQDGPIAVSCFTATAKPKVVADICDYFRREVGEELRLFAAKAQRTNLRYAVLHADGDDEKYALLRGLAGEIEGPCIIYASRTRRTEELADRLRRDGFDALAFHGRMDPAEKRDNQEAFMQGRVRIMVATSAFGMGVDKSDVALVVHYDISDSLENYVQEAGRAGRDPRMEARCYVLFGDQDLDKHFLLLNQTKISINEIKQVWKALKELTRQHGRVTCSALEVARAAGWEEAGTDIETRVRAAVAALEQSGFVSRSNNVPHVYATGIRAHNIDEARQRIERSPLFGEGEREEAVRIVKSLISSRSAARNRDDAESRVDYLADMLGMSKAAVVGAVERMRQEGILADSRDMNALLPAGDARRHAAATADRFGRLERFLFEQLTDDGLKTSLRQLNDAAGAEGLRSTTKDLRTLLNVLVRAKYITQTAEGGESLTLRLCAGPGETADRADRQVALRRFIIERLCESAAEGGEGGEAGEAGKAGKSGLRGKSRGRISRIPGVSLRAAPAAPRTACFSVVELLNSYRESAREGLLGGADTTRIGEVEEALLFLSQTGAIQLEGGFMVTYNAMQIERLKENKAHYRKEDYRLLDEFYRQKIQQIHIVGEYANMMVRDYAAAQRYVQDYFEMDYRRFIAKYFKGGRAAELEKNISPAKYRQLFGALSDRQREIIADRESRCIAVAAGPGSGKTRVLVHKLASLLLLEDVKHEQMLMLTFSRAAAIEFKLRLMELIGNAAHFVEIRTFHSYSFDLLGRIGSIEKSEDVVQQAADLIMRGEAEPSRTAKTVLVIDEAQDMDGQEYALVRALMSRNEEMRVIAVGDDDQNIYQFRGADSRYMQLLASDEGSRLYEMTLNYRCGPELAAVANRFAARLSGRLKQTPIAAAGPAGDHAEGVRHLSPYLERPIAEQLRALPDPGTTAILTSTNEEALRTVVLLNRCAIPCRLIQSMEGFRLYDLAEMRYFVRQLKLLGAETRVTGEVWEAAKRRTRSAYAESECLPAVEEFFARFEKTTRTVYLSDLHECLAESNIEDYYPNRPQEVVVSTIHKAKGREYDTVFLYLSGQRQPDQEYLRQVYVALTRARRRLYVHFAGSLFGPDDLPPGCFATDPTPYPEPSEIALQLGHREVHLSSFASYKQTILRLRSGAALVCAEGGLYLRIERAEGAGIPGGTGVIPIGRLSAKACQELAQWEKRGYRVTSAKARYIVAWHPKEQPNATIAVILPDLHLSKF